MGELKAWRIGKDTHEDVEQGLEGTLLKSSTKEEQVQELKQIMSFRQGLHTYMSVKEGHVCFLNMIYQRKRNDDAKREGIIARIKCWGKPERREPKAEIDQFEMHLSNLSFFNRKETRAPQHQGRKAVLSLWLLFSRQNEMRCQELMMRWKQKYWTFGVGRRCKIVMSESRSVIYSNSWGCQEVRKTHLGTVAINLKKDQLMLL